MGGVLLSPPPPPPPPPPPRRGFFFLRPRPGSGPTVNKFGNLVGTFLPAPPFCPYRKTQLLDNFCLLGPKICVFWWFLFFFAPGKCPPPPFFCFAGGSITPGFCFFVLAWGVFPVSPPPQFSRAPPGAPGLLMAHPPPPPPRSWTPRGPDCREPWCSASSLLGDWMGFFFLRSFSGFFFFGETQKNPRPRPIGP